MTAHLKLGAQFVTIVDLSNVINVNDANKDSFEIKGGVISEGIFNKVPSSKK